MVVQNVTTLGGGRNIIRLPDGREVKTLEQGKSYRYLGILETDEIKHKEMKNNLTKEYLRICRLRKLLQSKLNRVNVVNAISTWPVLVFRYSAPFVSWTWTELWILLFWE